MPIGGFEVIEPSGRRHSFRRKRPVDYLALAAALVANAALWVVILAPIWQWLVR